jgi:hypothetical protein
VLEGFLNAVLNEDVTVVTSLGKRREEFRQIVDLLVEDSKKELIPNPSCDL